MSAHHAGSVVSRLRQVRRIVDGAAFFFAWWSECSLSVCTGHDEWIAKPASSRALPERVPGVDALVREHDGHHAVGLEDAMRLAERAREQLLVVTVGKLGRGDGSLLALTTAGVRRNVLEERRIRDRLGLLVGERLRDELRPRVAQASASARRRSSPSTRRT